MSFIIIYTPTANTPGCGTEQVDQDCQERMVSALYQPFMPHTPSYKNPGAVSMQYKSKKKDKEPQVFMIADM